MRLIEKAFLHARECLKENWKEIKGPESNPNILKVYKSVDDLGIDEMDIDDSEIPWCACFANYCIQYAGGRGTRSAMARSFLKWGKKLTYPEVGCIVVLERGNNGWSGHVGFVVDWTDDIIEVLGGNQNNDVNIKEYDRSKVLGFRTSKD